MSFSLWVYASSLGGGSNWPALISKGNENSDGWRVYQDTVNPTITFAYFSSTDSSGHWMLTESLPLNKWYFVAVSFSLSANTVSMYANGVQTGSAGTTNAINPNSDALSLFDYRLNGMVADVQVYNTSLSPTDVQALYQEGIGGDPIRLKNLVGGWPLNGNTNDYSGNNDNAAATGAAYVGSWLSGYAHP